MKQGDKAEANKEMIALSTSEEWELVWEDSFSAPDIDASKWNHIEGGWDFGNEESNGRVIPMKRLPSRSR